MSHEPTERAGAELAQATPPDVLRQRVLHACHPEMAARAAARRRRRRAHWSLVAGVVTMLAVSHIEEQRLTARLDTLVQGPRAVATTPRATPTLIAAWRARAGLLASLLSDPHAL